MNSRNTRWVYTALAVVFWLPAGLAVADSEQSQATQGAAATADSSVAPPKGRVNRLLLLEERLSRALKGFSSEQSLEPTAPVPPPTVRRIAPKPRQDDEIPLRRENWMNMTPEDFAEHEASLELRKMLRDGGVLRDRRLSSDEQWLRDWSQQESSGTRGLIESMNRRDLSPGGARDRNSQAPAAIARSEEKLRTILQDRELPTLSNQRLRENSLSDIFSPNQDDFVASQRRQDSYVENYRRLLAPSPVTDFASSPLGMAATDPSRSVRPAPGLEPFNNPERNNPLGPQFGSINPLYSPRSPVDATERAVNQWNKYYTPPAPEPPRSATPPKPTFEAPRRKF